MRAATVLVALASLQATPSLETTLSRLHAYLLDYEPRLKSEITFVRLPGEGPWLGYRNVTTVNGKAVVARPDRLQALLAQGGDEGRRTYEMAVPTLPLEILHPRHRERFTFELHGVQRIDGRRLRHLAFEEVSRPTLIRNPDGSDIISYGSVWLEEPSGRVFEAEVRSVAGTQPIRTLPEAILRVSFAENAAMGLLVPIRMRETFAIGRTTGRGVARYSNFRRFETAARIIPEP